MSRWWRRRPSGRNVITRPKTCKDLFRYLFRRVSEGFVIRREKRNKVEVRTLSWPRFVVRLPRLVFGNHIFALAELERGWYRYSLY